MPPAAIPRSFDAFLAEPRNAILCIGRGADRPPHATPVWFVYDGARFRISITRTRVKYHLLQQTAHVTLVVDDALGNRSVIVEGSASVEDGDAPLLALARALGEKYVDGEPGTDAELLRRLHAEQRVVVTVEPQHVLAWSG
ncbi:MAG: hypothetical protein EXR63_05355 [Dehalococcoidia bacterium]|nr:hypothetical protein [Dehalococcoidia bacterium]